ncbi:hypothetical protein [Streptomyces sp. NPDC051577]|uniref:hypothetical protein n=1 Tax=Streptomyces sp. NPDC051577 TaxID=3155166 RepID=UPI00342F035B
MEYRKVGELRSFADSSLHAVTRPRPATSPLSRLAVRRPRISGKPLGALLHTRLFTATKPEPDVPALRTADGLRLTKPRSWRQIKATNEVHTR